MKKTEKINRSRYTLKEILSNEWDTSLIPDYSDAEIEKMYLIQTIHTNNLVLDLIVILY